MPVQIYINVIRFMHAVGKKILKKKIMNALICFKSYNQNTPPPLDKYTL